MVTSNPLSPEFIPEGYDATDDDEIMEANGAGMDSYDVGQGLHDNPYQVRCLRDAWHQGWQSAQRTREDGEVLARGYTREPDGRLLYTT